MEQEVSKKQTLKLAQTVVRRSVPMTEKGSDMLRAARDHIVDELFKETGVAYEAPFPVVFHMVLKDYCEMKGIDVNANANRRKH